MTYKIIAVMNLISIKHDMKIGVKRSKKMHQLNAKNKNYKNFKAHILIYVSFIVFINSILR